MDNELITREILGNVPAGLARVFYVVTFAVLGWSAWRFYRRAAARREGRPAETQAAARPGWRTIVTSAVQYLAFHRQLLQDRYAGIAHLLTFYGFVILFIGTCLVFLEHQTPLHFFYGTFYCVASLVVDLGGVAFLAGLGIFLWRRHRPGESRLLKQAWVAALGWLLFFIGVTGFLLEGARIARDFPPFERWSAVGYSVALLFHASGVSGDAAPAAHRFLWGTHAALCAGFFALLPWKFFGHMAYGLASWTTRSRRPLAALAPVTLDGSRSPGASQPRHLSRLDLLQVDACTTCGRCNDVCPAHAAGKPLHPREIVLGVRQALDAAPSAEMLDWIEDDALWSCTTCAACSGTCPVGIDVHGKIIELRRGRVETGVIPPAAEQVFESVAARFNPFQKSNDDRLEFARGLPVPVAAPDEAVELLYWVGCAGSFDPQGQSVARSMIKILNHLQIPYRVLGTKERCTGDVARRLGEEGLFQELARDNLGTFRKHRVRRILTHCPHCWNTLRNEYPHVADIAAFRDCEVIHHSHFLAELIGSGRISLQAGGPDRRPTADRITFHDPCYLGRGNSATVAPRAVIAGLTGKESVEMPRHGRNSFCCGAGGGAMWLDVRGTERVETLRFQEAAETGAETIATGCPFCKTMLDAARTAQGATATARVRQVKDIAELVADGLGL